jgi:hypothetical protein
MAIEGTRSRWASWVGAIMVVIAVLAAAIVLTRPLWSDFLFSVTGEESIPAQLRAGLEWLGNVTRPQPETADAVPVDHAGINPFGVNTFLEQEVEREKRELAVQMIADAGFHWIRQEFPWEDIEIHGKGDFEDRRHDPYRSAWQKYDHIVDLVERYDLEIIVRLSNPPAWTRTLTDTIGAQAPPDDLEDYGDYVETVVRRYEGRVHHYQIWNEPNIYPEWGEQPVSPEQYTELLKVGYTRIKEACPECVVLSGALAQTIPLGPRDLNDFLFLQRMYDAGAGDYFDVLAMQGYGLWSGPTDRRMRPRVLNFSRPLYLREIMVENGDEDKPIWITEMNWNAPPPDLPDKPFGFVTLEQQARYAVLAYQRAQREWPWVGVVNTWFFKRATDTEKDQAMYYFRLAEADFTTLPVYEELKEYMHSFEAQALYPGVHQEDHWAVIYEGEWETRSDPAAELGGYRVAEALASSATFAFEGKGLVLKAGPEAEGMLAYSLDGEAEASTPLAAGEQIELARGLSRGLHTVTIRPETGVLALDSVTVQGRAPISPWSAVGAGLLLAGLIGVVVTAVVGRRGPWYRRSRAPR